MSDVIASVKTKQRKIKELQKTQAQNEGSKAQVLKQLKEKFDVDSQADAEVVLSEFMQEKKKNEELLETLDQELAGIIKCATKAESEVPSSD